MITFIDKYEYYLKHTHPVLFNTLFNLLYNKNRLREVDLHVLWYIKENMSLRNEHNLQKGSEPLRTGTT